MTAFNAAPAERAAAVVVGAYLRHLRARAGASLVEIAGVTGRDVSTLSRIERGEVTSTGADIKGLLYRHFDQTIGQAEAVAQLLKATGEQLDDQGEGWRDRLAVCEQQATDITAYQATVIPAALRTRSYDKALTVPDRGFSAPDRVSRLQPKGPRKQSYVAFLDASVLERPVGGPAVMAGQLGHLLRLMRLGRATVRLVPTEKGSVTWHGNVSRLVVFGDHLYVHEGLAARYTIALAGQWLFDPLLSSSVLAVEKAARLALSEEETVEALRDAHRRMMQHAR